MTSYIDDKSAACHVNFLSAKSKPFCKGGSIIMGWVRRGLSGSTAYAVVLGFEGHKNKFNRRNTLCL